MPIAPLYLLLREVVIMLHYIQCNQSLYLSLTLIYALLRMFFRKEFRAWKITHQTLPRYLFCNSLFSQLPWHIKTKNKRYCNTAYYPRWIAFFSNFCYSFTWRTSDKSPSPVYITVSSKYPMTSKKCIYLTGF